MELHEDGWLYDGRSANRLWEKSALGRKISDGKIILSDAELLFCHKHRGLSLPNMKILNRMLTHKKVFFLLISLIEEIFKPTV